MQTPASNPISVAHAFQLATRSGGHALRRKGLGVTRVGTKADIVVWNTKESISILGLIDPVAAVMLHATIEDTLDDKVDGKFFKRNKWMLAPKLNRIRTVRCREKANTGDVGEVALLSSLSCEFPSNSGKFTSVGQYHWDESRCDLFARATRQNGLRLPV